VLACAVMANHVHLVLGVTGDPAPPVILRDMKRRASRALNADVGASPRWWTRSGSVRRLKTDEDVLAAVEYVRQQSCPRWCG
jgi:REP element-mobilizing transposase RayT